MSTLEGFDDETALIVTWFCRNVQNMLSQLIPQEIVAITFKFTSGTYKWKIDDNALLDKIFNATNAEKMESDVFKRDKLDFKLRIYPNGMNSLQVDSFDVFLILNTMPEEYKCITVSFIINSPQTFSKWGIIQNYTHSGTKWGWISYALSLSELKELNPSEIILIVDIEILRIIKKETNEILYQNPFIMDAQMQINETWFIDENIMNNIKHLQTFGKGKSLNSNVFHNMWIIALYPIGIKTNAYTSAENECLLGVNLCYLPINVSKISIRSTITLIEANKTEITNNCIYSADCSYGDLKKLCSFDEFINYSQHTISINIIILQVWNNNNEIIYSYNPSHKIIKKWNQKNKRITSGSYEWVIQNEKLLNHMLNSEVTSKFKSIKFCIAGFEWRFVIYPNGHSIDRLNSFDVFLELDSLPIDWNCIIQFQIYSPQTESKMTAIVEYHSSLGLWGWDHNSMLLSEIKTVKPSEIILNANIEIIRIIKMDSNIILYQNPLNINIEMVINKTWIIDSDLMNRIKGLIIFGKQLSSDIFGDIWVIRLCPYGFEKTNNGECQLGLALCNLPFNISNICVKYEILLIEANKRKICQFEYSVENECDYQTLCTFEEFIKFSTHTIVVNINITNMENVKQ
eukprot:81602_1